MPKSRISKEQRRKEQLAERFAAMRKEAKEQSSESSESEVKEAPRPLPKTTSKLNYIKLPEDFDGNKEKFEKFWLTIETFLTTYPYKFDKQPDLKILFILSYMNSGQALLYRKSTMK